MRSFKLLGVLCLLAAGATGCGTETVASASVGGETSPSRSRQVADAWEGSEAARLWREGFFPLDELVQLPEEAFRDGKDETAYQAGRFTLSGSLPKTSGKQRIRWTGGESLPVTVMTAEKAYGILAGNNKGKDSGSRLTVTKVELGEMRLRTSRGSAAVPAWLFTLDGYDTPLKRAAVSPSELPEAPIEPAKAATDDLMPLEGLKVVARDGLTVTVLAGHGGCDDGAAVDVLETDDSVVFSGSVRGGNDGLCTAELVVDPVTVKLDRQIGTRVLLDAFTGKPVQQPAWSS